MDVENCVCHMTVRWRIKKEEYIEELSCMSMLTGFTVCDAQYIAPAL